MRCMKCMSVNEEYQHILLDGIQQFQILAQHLGLIVLVQQVMHVSSIVIHEMHIIGHELLYEYGQIENHILEIV